MQHLKWKEIVNQFIRFCIVGGTNTCVSYGINILTLFLLRPLDLSWDYFVANAASYLLGTPWAYFWGAKFVFHAEKQKMQDVLKGLMKSYTSYAITGIVLSNLVSWIWIAKLGMSRYSAPLINVAICTPISFLLNRCWTFRGASRQKRM